MRRTRPGTSRPRTGRSCWPRPISCSTETWFRRPGSSSHGVAPVPYRCTAAENAITGKRVSLETAALAGEAAAAGAAPLSMNAYKVPLTTTVVKRALLGAVGNRYWEEA